MKMTTIEILCDPPIVLEEYDPHEGDPDAYNPTDPRYDNMPIVSTMHNTEYKRKEPSFNDPWKVDIKWSKELVVPLYDVLMRKEKVRLTFPDGSKLSQYAEVVSYNWDGKKCTLQFQAFTTDKAGKLFLPFYEPPPEPVLIDKDGNEYPI